MDPNITLTAQFKTLTQNLTDPKRSIPLLIASKVGNPGVHLLNEHLELWEYLIKGFVLVRDLSRLNDYFFWIVPKTDNNFIFNRNRSCLEKLMILFEHHLNHLPFDQAFWEVIDLED